MFIFNRWDFNDYFSLRYYYIKGKETFTGAKESFKKKWKGGKAIVRIVCNDSFTAIKLHKREKNIYRGKR